MTGAADPFRPAPWEEVEADLAALLSADTAEPTALATLRPFDAVRANARRAMERVDLAYDWSQPSARRILAETASMVRAVLGVPEVTPVRFTEGGTESVFLALLAAREWAREARPRATRPAILIPRSAHSCFDRAARYLGLRVVRAPVRDDFRADVAAMEAAIDEDTILVAASCPSDPYGQCDPVPEIAGLALRHGLWCHADACLGGFLVPFLRGGNQALPAFGFEVPGVRSISADPHKYGFTPTGLSALLFRDEADARPSETHVTDWAGPVLASQRTAGTRSWAPVAGAWATFRQLGLDGLARRARLVQANAEALADRLAAEPGVRLLCRPEAGMVLFQPLDVPAERVAAAFRVRGHKALLTREPPSLVACCGPEARDGDLDLYCANLRAAMAEVRAP